MANNEHIQMKQLEIIERFDLQKKKVAVPIFGEISPKPKRVMARSGKFQVFELQDASFVVISHN